MSTFNENEKKVLSFMEQVKEDMEMREHEDDYLNSTKYKLQALDKCEDEGKNVCLDKIIRTIYKDAIPLNDDYKTAYDDDIDASFDIYMQKKCPKGIEYYVREGLKKKSDFARKVLEAVDELVNDQIHDKGLNIDDLDSKDLVFASDDDVTKKLDIIGSDMGTPEISQAVHDNVKATALSEINRAKMNKENLKNLENELKNDISINSPQALESALGVRDLNTERDYKPTLFEAMMISKLNDIQTKMESGEVEKTYLYHALDDYNRVTEESEDTINFATDEELAFVETVKEYTLLSVLKALKLESFNPYTMNELIDSYATSK